MPTKTLASDSQRYCSPMVLWCVQKMRPPKPRPADEGPFAPSLYVTIFEAVLLSRYPEPALYLTACTTNCKESASIPDIALKHLE